MCEHAILRWQLSVMIGFVMLRVRLDAVGVAVALVLGTLAVAPIVEAQRREPPPRIAVVFGVSALVTMLGAEPSHPYVRAPLTEPRELGYVEDQNLIIEHRSLEGHDDRAPEVFAELLRLPVHVIVAAPSEVARAARRATTTISIVVGDATADGPLPPDHGLTWRLCPLRGNAGRSGPRHRRSIDGAWYLEGARPEHGSAGP